MANLGNLVSNGDFEVDASGWTGVLNCTIARSTLQANTGAASLAVTATAAGDMSPHSDTMPVTEGRDYCLSFAVRAATVGSAWVFPQINWQHGATWLSNVQVQNTDVTTGFVIVTVSGRAPQTANNAYAALYLSAAGIGNVHYIDTVDFHELPPGFFASVGKPGPRVSNRTGRLQGGY